MSEGWYPGAIERPGPEWKQGYEGAFQRYGRGVVVHSAEGSLSSAFGILDGPASKSWLATVAKDGRVYQHYQVKAVTWHAGQWANERFAGVETEGVAGEELTTLQLAGLIGILNFLRSEDRWPEVSREATLHEHNEYMATACPSGRIPWPRIIAALDEVPGEPGPPDWGALVVLAAFLRNNDDPNRLSTRDKDACRRAVALLNV